MKRVMSPGWEISFETYGEALVRLQGLWDAGESLAGAYRAVGRLFGLSASRVQDDLYDLIGLA
jgi:hypothetical protein